MVFNATLNPDFVVQTLGAIVQAYASILAIVGAFYIFLMERTRSELRDTRDRLENAVNNFYINVTSNRAEFYDNLRYRGFDFLDELADGRSNMKERPGYRNLVERYLIYRAIEMRGVCGLLDIFRRYLDIMLLFCCFYL